MFLAVAEIVETLELNHDDYEKRGRLHLLKACHGYPLKKQVTCHAVTASVPSVISNSLLCAMLILSHRSV